MRLIILARHESPSRGMTQSFNPDELSRIRSRLEAHARALGFQQLGVSGVDLRHDEARLQRWLGEGRHGEMKFMERHGVRRSRPAELIPGTVRVISLRMDCHAPEPVAGELVMGMGQMVRRKSSVDTGLAPLQVLDLIERPLGQCQRKSR